MELLLRTSFDIPKPPGQASAGLFDREYPLRIRISHYIKSFIGAALPCQLAKNPILNPNHVAGLKLRNILKCDSDKIRF